jgi:hypothetical protein
MARNRTRKPNPAPMPIVETPPVVVDMTEFQALMQREIRNIVKDDENFKPAKYTKDQIRTFLLNPQKNERQLREISQYLFTYSMHYQRLLSYFASMLTFDYVLTPVLVASDKMSSSKFKKAYESASLYMENFNVKYELGVIVAIMMLDGVFFGYERVNNESFMIQRLPTNFCRVTGKEDNTWTFALDFSYFDKDPLLLENVYPPEFKSMYNKYKSDSTNNKWQELDPSKALCFKFDETSLANVPPFTGVFEDAIDLREYKDLYKIKSKVENIKLLLQKIPMKKEPKSEKDFAITLPTVKIFHKGIKDALPEGIMVVSTPMDVTDIDFEKARDKEDKVGNAERNFYSTTGTSQLLGNSDKTGSVGLEASIKSDEGFMFKLLRMFECYFRKRLFTQVTTNAQMRFKVIMPDLTIYNRTVKQEEYLKAAQFGGPVSLVAASMGVQTHDFVALIDFEGFLGLKDKMVPLVSSHTQTATDTGGAPTKKAGALSDAGAISKDTNKNAT